MGWSEITWKWNKMKEHLSSPNIQKKSNHISSSFSSMKWSSRFIISPEFLFLQFSHLHISVHFRSPFFLHLHLFVVQPVLELQTVSSIIVVSPYSVLKQFLWFYWLCFPSQISHHVDQKLFWLHQIWMLRSSLLTKCWCEFSTVFNRFRFYVNFICNSHRMTTFLLSNSSSSCVSASSGTSSHNSCAMTDLSLP